MLINHTYNFLFVHIQKTAGTSITSQLRHLEGTEPIGYAHTFLKTILIDHPDRYFKFCFVRNPWERLLSWYNMIKHHGIGNDWGRYVLENSRSFSEFLDLTDIIYESNLEGLKFEFNYPKSITFNQLDYISDAEGNILVDYIGRFENLHHDYAFIMKRLKIPYTSLPHLNKVEHESYRRYYTDADIEKVYQLYKRDIDYFNYHF